MNTQVETKELEAKPEIVQFELKKKKTPPAYTKAEDQIILDQVMQYPDNISHGCNQAAKKLKNRKPSSIQARYYYLVRKDSKKSVIINGSAAGFSNKKVNKTKGGVIQRNEPLKPLAVIIKQLLEFNPEERRKVQEFLKMLE